MKKKSKEKNVTSDEIIEQYDDFNEENFGDLEEVTDEEMVTEMSDTESHNDLNPEYHGADPDLPSDEVSHEKKSIATILKENWLYIGIGLIVLVVAIYLVMSVFSTPENANQNTQSATPSGFTNIPATPPSGNNSANAPSQTPVPSQGVTSASAPGVSSTGAPTPGGVNSAQTISPAATASDATLSDAQTQALLQSINKLLEQNMNNLKNSLSGTASGKSAQSLSSIENSISTLSGNVEKLNQNLAAVQAKLASTDAQLSILLASQTATDQNLTLRAVVPGRAWLIDQNGHTTSVTEGTSLGSFGVITNIDSTNNTVTTSSGYVFK